MGGIQQSKTLYMVNSSEALSVFLGNPPKITRICQRVDKFLGCSSLIFLKAQAAPFLKDKDVNSCGRESLCYWGYVLIVIYLMITLSIGSCRCANVFTYPYLWGDSATSLNQQLCGEWIPLLLSNILRSSSDSNSLFTTSSCHPFPTSTPQMVSSL